MATQLFFDVKTVGLLANQDAGASTRGRYVPATIEYVTANSAAFNIDVNDISTYGGGAFKTGQAIGFLGFQFNGSEYHIGINQYAEVKTGGRAYIRFGYINFTLKSTSVIYS